MVREPFCRRASGRPVRPAPRRVVPVFLVLWLIGWLAGWLFLVLLSAVMP